MKPNDSRAPYWLLVVFALSRLAYFAAGVRFDARPLDKFFQIADPLLLKTRLIETLWNLHTQPPGFNLMIGLVLKLFPDHFSAALHAVYLLCGASLCFTLFRLMRIAGVRIGLSMAITALFMISPGVVLFENLLIYEYPLAALLCGSAVLFHRLLTRPSPWVATAFFSILTVLVWTRALFHLGWFVLVAVFIVWFASKHRRMVLASVAVPFALCCAVYLKNVFVIGSFTASTWLGFNADTIALHQLTPEEHQRFAESGELSKVGLHDLTDPLAAFGTLVTLPAQSGIPVLDQVNDSTGRINYNHLGYLLLRPYYIADAKQIILHHPNVYFRSLEKAWFAYFLPTGDFPFFDQNRPKIRALDRLFNILFFGQWKDASNRKDLRKLEAAGGTAQLPLYTGTYLLIGLPALFGAGIVWLWKEVRRKGWTPDAALLAFMLFNIGFVTAVVNFLSSFENNRYRLPIDPLFATLLAMAIERGIRAVRQQPAQTRQV